MKFGVFLPISGRATGPDTLREAARSAEALGLRPEQCLMVAAHPADLASAARCGLRTAYVPRPLEFGPGRPGSQPEPGQPFDVVAGDFVELAEKLGC